MCAGKGRRLNFRLNRSERLATLISVMLLCALILAPMVGAQEDPGQPGADGTATVGTTDDSGDTDGTVVVGDPLGGEAVSITIGGGSQGGDAFGGHAEGGDAIAGAAIGGAARGGDATGGPVVGGDTTAKDA